MARHYSNIEYAMWIAENSYADLLINHAQFLYDFADRHRARYDAFSIPGAKDYYP